ncbi:putative tellurite resistance protein B-like protein [Saonia flava]|uniref:Putative tellurite resistance protein B-like protein n=1 Tax=Saonia flava TaxID=523696 RepID=A0A846R332_9FLAO|nr:TerB family tellurite resistance protein [Saonia flava]NJB71774.1 putative tellurite resistance protein B-like protein [Saonia flava]
MSFTDLYGNSEHRRNLAHFASIASLAAVDGVVNDKELVLLNRFAKKLDITEAEYEEVMKKENKYPIETPHSSEVRLERLFDLFKIIFADHDIDENELSLLKKYAIGLGFSNENAESIIRKSVLIFSGRIDFEDYLYLVKK